MADAEFWHKRADYYKALYLELLGRMADGVNINSIQLNENGLTFMVENMSPQSKNLCDYCRFTFYAKSTENEEII